MARDAQYIKNDIADLQEELLEAKQKEDYDKCASQLKGMYDAFVEAGFEEEQAWELITIMMKKG